MVALTGGVSMGLEVLASRSLSLLFGPSLQSLALVLMAFILGIGLGSALITSPRWQRFPSEKIIVFCLLAAALWLGLLVFQIESWPTSHYAALAVKSGLQQNNLRSSRTVLDLGLQLDPASPQLNYLARIWSESSNSPAWNPNSSRTTWAPSAAFCGACLQATPGVTVLPAEGWCAAPKPCLRFCVSPATTGVHCVSAEVFLVEDPT